MSVGKREFSLTRQYRLESYRMAAAALEEGMTLQDVETVLKSHDAYAEQSESLFKFDEARSRLVLDELIRVCKSSEPEIAHQLIWVARLWIEHRLAKAVEAGLTDERGKLIPERINRSTVEGILGQWYKDDALRKASSNVLRYLAQAHIIDPLEHGGSIIGMERALPTAAVVPHAVTFVSERAPAVLNFDPPPGTDPVDIAVVLGVNRWINLTADEFRRAARASALPDVRQLDERPEIPGDLRVLDEELRRRGQVVLQGAPGVGKTYQAIQYINWLTAGRRSEAQVARLLKDLPSHERTPEMVADIAQRLGLAAVWDIVQFHPSYGYEDFVRTLAPRPGPTGMTFVTEHRQFSFLAAVGLRLMAAGSKADVLLVVDEVNRADISRVFGELLYGLEYRGEPVTTPHLVDGSTSLTVPRNLLLLGTMNTADRSIALIDYALRRRFTFLDLAPNREAVASARWHGDIDRQAALELYDLVANVFAGPDPTLSALAVGHSYFLPDSPSSSVDKSIRRLARRFAYELFPLLREYAAEGLVDGDRIADLGSVIGIDSVLQDQRQTADAVYAWLTGKSRPGE